MDEYIGVLSLDLDCRKNLPKISVGQFDKGRKYLVSITKNSIPFSAQNSTVILQGKRQDKSCFSIACTVNDDGTVTFELNDEILSVSGIAFAKLILSDSTRNYSTQIFAIDVDASFEGSIDDKENHSVLNDLINRLMLLFELDNPNVTEFPSCKGKVEEYLSLSDYSPDDYSTSHIPNPTGIDNNHYDRSNGIDIDLPSDSAKIVLRDAVTGKERAETVSGISYKIENLIPDHLYSYNILNTAGLSLKIGTCRANGHVRMINGGGDTYNIRDIGGWTCDGGRLKYGLIYRGSELNVHVSTLAPTQIALFKDLLEIRDEIDLRSDNGAAGITDTALGVGVGYIRVPLPYYTNILVNTTAGDGPELTAQIMRRIIGNLRSGKVSYLHGEVGADRTGTIAMLIEAVCGVSQSDLDRDYEMTSFSFNPNGEHNIRRRSNGSDVTANWKTLIASINNLEGDSFQDKVIRFLLRCGVSIDELNALRDCLIDGEPEKLVNPYGNITVTKNLTNIRTDNDADSIEMYQPFETELIVDNAYEITALRVMMGGADVSSYLNYGKLCIPHVTGDIVIIGSAQKSDISTLSARAVQQSTVIITKDNWQDYSDANSFTPNRTYGISSHIIGAVPPEGETPDPNYGYVDNLPSYGSSGYLLYYTAASGKSGVQFYQNKTESWYRTVNSSGAGTWIQSAAKISLDKAMQPLVIINTSNCINYPDANSLTPNRTYGIQSGITSDMVANLPSYGSTGFLMYYTASSSARNGVQLYHNAAESWYRMVDNEGEGTWVRCVTGDVIKPETTLDENTCKNYPDANAFTPNRTYCILNSITSDQVKNLPSYGSTGYLMYYTASASIKNGVQFYHNAAESWYRTVNSSGAGTWIQLGAKKILDRTLQIEITITTSNCSRYPDANAFTPNRTYGIQNGITSDMVANLPSYGSTGFLMYYTASSSARNGVQLYHNAAESWYRTVDSTGVGTWVKLTQDNNPNVDIENYFVSTCVDKPIVLQSGKGLFIFGDSITTNSHGHLTWGSIIATKTGCTEHNYGVGSAAFVPPETRPDLKIMTQIDGVPSDNWVNCDVCIVAAGTNDSNYHTTAEALRTEVQNVITAIKAKAPNAKIIFITPIRRSDSALRLSQLPVIAGAICNVALINGCSVINGFDFPIPTYSNDWIENLTSDSTGLPVSDEHPGDGLHPGIVGKRIYAQSVLNALL